MADKEPKDAMVEAQIERIISQYRHQFPPEALATCREVLRDVLTAHPVASRWMKKLRDTPQMTSSGIVASDGRDEIESVAYAVEKAGRGGSR